VVGDGTEAKKDYCLYRFSDGYWKALEKKLEDVSKEAKNTPEEHVAYDDPPKLIKLVKPKYPDASRRLGIEGMVILKILVEVDGRVSDVKILKSIGDVACDKAAIKAARQCLFEPATQGDKPVSVWVSYPVRFVLKDVH